MNKEYSAKPIPNEERYVDFDEDTNCFGIFGSESGFCYSIHFSEKAANNVLLKQINSKKE